MIPRIFHGNTKRNKHGAKTFGENSGVFCQSTGYRGMIMIQTSAANYNFTLIAHSVKNNHMFKQFKITLALSQRL